ncbi:c2h2 transcription [Fusarium agapanthi]|uniref:C2h2 transcription n=1 Tax=Fusarium agapanthi TaxID=1803897 RepID=A0A9P5EFH7_9HYPO|nr:c2h2 transcription [Fusarium agapanthi]
MATFVPLDASLPFRSFDYLRHKYTLDQAVQASTPDRARSDLSNMSKDRLVAYVASHGFERRKFRFGSSAVLLQRAEAIWDFLQGPQTAEAEDSLQAFMASTVVRDDCPSRAVKNVKQIRHKDSKRKGVLIEMPPAVTAPEATWVKRSPAPEAETSNSLSTEEAVTIKIMTTEVEQIDLAFLKDVDLSAFPKCKPCFKRRHACIQGRPCSECGGKREPCTQVTMKDLQESPEHALVCFNSMQCAQYLQVPPLVAIARWRDASVDAQT